MTKQLILNFSEMAWDINTKFLPIVKLYGNPLCMKYEGSYNDFGQIANSNLCPPVCIRDESPYTSTLENIFYFINVN